MNKKEKELTVPDLQYLKSFVKYGNQLNEAKIRERIAKGGMELLFVRFDVNNIHYNNSLLKKINFKIRQLRKLRYNYEK